MKNKKIILTLLTGWFIITTIAFLVPIPQSNSNVGFFNIPHFDKWVHIFIFAVFTGLIYFYYRMLNTTFIISLIFTGTYGIVIEISQRFVGRGFDMKDYAADFAGIFLCVLGILIFKYFKYGKALRQRRISYEGKN
jgi:VanZ family protein